jgi:hypothetical protein
MDRFAHFTTGGRFFAPGDDGQMRPLHEFLRVEAGQDFEKCVRSNTIFNYNNCNAGFETHEEFWKGRRFKVLMMNNVKNKEMVWVMGKVVKWEEYNMG